MEVINENQNMDMNVEEYVDMEGKGEHVDPERLDQILTDYQRVHDAACNEIDRKRRAVRTKCEERVWMAALWRDYQLEIVKKSFENEIKQIEREHQSEFNSLKDSLMQELQDERKKLQALEEASAGAFSVDKTGNLVAKDTSSSVGPAGDAMTAAILAAEEQASAAATSRRLRRREEKASEALNGLAPISAVTNSSTAAPLSTANTNRRKQVNNIYTYNTMLQEQDILDDLGAIAKEAGSLGTSRRAAAVIKNTGNSSNGSAANPVSNNNMNVIFEKGVLHYNWDIIAVSDRIRLQLTPTSSVINCSVLTCSASELVVSTASRNQIKIPLADLKSGKVTIYTEDHLLHDN